jgi:hypothetical protein
MICLKSRLNVKYTRLHTSTSICTYIYVSWFLGQIADADRVIFLSPASQQWHMRNYASGNATPIRSLYVNHPASTVIESRKWRYCFLPCGYTLMGVSSEQAHKKWQRWYRSLGPRDAAAVHNNHRHDCPAHASRGGGIMIRRTGGSCTRANAQARRPRPLI